jgi:hypothetical protein
MDQARPMHNKACIGRLCLSDSYRDTQQWICVDYDSSVTFASSLFFYRRVNSGQVVETLVEKQTLGVKEGMKIGDRVRVKDSVVVYHHPEHRGKGFDLKGAEGEVIGIINQWQGRPVSANLPIYVQFSKKFKAHLRESELELL